MTLTRCLALVVFGASLVAACGAATDVGGIDNSGSASPGGSGGGSSGGTGNTGNSGGSSSGAASGSGGASASSSGTASGSSGVASSSSGAGEAGSSSGSSSGVSDAGAAGTAMIACGRGLTCAAPQVCCAGLSVRFGPTEACEASQNACTRAGGNSYMCSGATNCANGEVCCVTVTLVGRIAMQLAQCQATCAASGAPNTTFQFVVCQSNADCPNGMICVPANDVNLPVCR